MKSQRRAALGFTGAIGKWHAAANNKTLCGLPVPEIVNERREDAGIGDICIGCRHAVDNIERRKR